MVRLILSIDEADPTADETKVVLTEETPLLVGGETSCMEEVSNHPAAEYRDTFNILFSFLLVIYFTVSSIYFC